MTNQVKIGAILSYVTLAINIVIGLVYTPWMIRTIGQSDYGLYALAMSVINMFIFDFGLGTAVQRFVAKYIAEGNAKRANEFVSITMRMYITISTLIVVALLFVYTFLPEIYKGLTPDELQKFKVIFAVASIFSAISFPLLPADGILCGNEQFVQVKICDFLHKILLVTSMTICLLMGLGLYALVYVSAITAFITLLLKVACLYRYTHINLSFKIWDKQLFKSVVGFTVWVFIIAVCQRCVVSIAPSILGVYHNADVIAIFSIALSIEGYFFLFANAINGLFLPKVSRLIANEREDEILKLMIRVGIIQIFISGLIFCGLISFGQQFLRLWVGDGYEIVYPCFIILILPSFISLPENIASTAMVAKNKVRYQALAAIAKAILNLALAFPLSKYYGSLGMCIAISAAYCINVLINNVLYITILKLNIAEFFRETFGKFIIPIVVVLLIGLGLNYIFKNDSWGILLVKVLIFSSLYSFVIPYLIGTKNRVVIFSTVTGIIRKRNV